MIARLLRSLHMTTIRAKVIAAALVTAGVALLASTVSLVAYHYREEQLNLCSEVKGISGVLAENLHAAVMFQNRDGATTMLAGLRANPRIRSAEIDLKDGNGNFAAWQADANPVADRWYTPSCTYSSPIMVDGEFNGLIWLQAADVDFLPSVARFASVLLLAAGLGLLSAVAIGGRFARRIADPVARLAQATRHVGDSADYGMRVPVQGEGEIGQLVQNFNGMLEQLEGHNRELTVYRDSLRDQVEERTAELRVAKERAEAASEAKSRFLATMSHEIRTPLNGVLGMNELLIESGLTERQATWAEAVQNSGRHLLGVINDILDFSKIESGHMSLESVDFDMAEVVEDVLTMFAQQAERKHLELAAQFLPNDAKFGVRGDPLRMHQIMVNLVGNAIKFTERGEVVVRVQQTSRDAGVVGLRITVSDTGIGIPPKVRETIFESFSQADNSTTRRFGGTGLGLAICRRLLDLMGASIRVHSEIGAGSTFVIELQLPEASVAQQAEVPTGRLADVQVLVVDDNPTNRDILREQLEGWRMTVTCAADAQAALQLLDAPDARPYSLAILDLHMPGMDGLDLACAIRERPKLSNLKLMMLSSTYTHAPGGEERRKTAIERYLNKPIRRADLLKAVVGTLDGTFAARQARRPAPGQGGGALAGHVLLVEDQAVNQEVALSMLNRIGVSVELAHHGGQALELVEREHFDLVLMDCQMPVMDGYEATARIRALPGGRGAKLPIVALTANAMSEDAQKCLDAGMDAFLAKPYTLAALREMLQRYLPQATVPEAPVPTVLPAKADAGGPVAGEGPPAIEMAALETLRELDGEGGWGLAGRILRMFLDTAEQEMARTEAAVAAGDARVLAQVAHAMKSSSANVGARLLSECYKDLERCGREGRLDEARERIARARLEHDRAVARVQALLLELA